MQIALLPQKYSEELTRDGLAALPKDYLAEITRETREIDPAMKVEEINYGAGADWIWILLGLYTLKNILIVGEPINKGIDGWINIGKKILRLKKKTAAIKLDADGIALLCLLDIHKKSPEIISLEKVIQYEHIIEELSGMLHNDSAADLNAKVNVYYVIGFKVNGSKLYVYGSDISGNIKLLVSQS